MESILSTPLLIGVEALAILPRRSTHLQETVDEAPPPVPPVVRLSEERGQNNQQPTPNDNKSERWSSSAFLVYDLHRGMCCKPSGKVQEGREGLLMGNICDW